MTTITHGGRSLRGHARLPASIVSLSLLLTALFVGAVQGGVAMVADPLNPLGMTTDWLDRSPVDDYFWPGVFLLGIAVASLLSVVGLILRWPWRWASRIERVIGFRWPWLAAVATGAVLLVFEIIELFVVPFHPVMHPLVLAGSAVIIGLALSPGAREHLAAD